MRKILSTTICLLFLIGFFGCSADKIPSKGDGILGTWYESVGGEVEVIHFYDNGTCFRTPEIYLNEPNQDVMSYEYDENVGTLQFELDEYAAEAVLEDDKLTYTYEEYEETHTLYRDRETAQTADPAYYINDAFTDTIMDDDGFCVKDGILYAYRGEAVEVTVPADVHTIYMEAFSGDYNHGVNLKKVIVPGTVREIQSQAFAFTNADVIVIEEGVETIGDMAFMDSYIDEIHFPASLKNIGQCIMESEEGQDGTKIYVPAGSTIEKYFETNMPYGETKLYVEN